MDDYEMTLSGELLALIALMSALERRVLAKGEPSLVVDAMATLTGHSQENVIDLRVAKDEPGPARHRANALAILQLAKAGADEAARPGL